MFYISTDENSPYIEKVKQDINDVSGRIVAYGYDVKWIDPLIIADIKDGRISKGNHTWIGIMTLGNCNKPVRLCREATIERIKIYNDSYVRIDLRLLPDNGQSKTYPAKGKENYLFSY